MTRKLLLPAIILTVIIAADQWIKYYVKTHFFLGEEVNIAGRWARLHFTENYGMAFGLEFGGKAGKLLLTLFRVAAVSAILYYILSLARKPETHTAYLVCWTLIFAGALGNIIDSVFYGVIFGYDGWFHGRVVDMFYFPIIQTTLPQSFPIWGGEDFEFFRPVFNLADAAISTGFIAILLFQGKFFKETKGSGEAAGNLNPGDGTTAGE
jgi:signal peptidase II